MKIYVRENGVSLVGKAWEIKRKLLEYGKQYATISDWIHHERVRKTVSHNVISFPIKNEPEC